MGRTQTVGDAETLKKQIELCENNKKRLIDFFQQAKKRYFGGELAYSKYEKIINKKRDGRTILEWIKFYDNYKKECNETIKHKERKAVKNKTLLAFSSLAFIAIIFLAIFYINPTIIGLAVKEQKQEFVQQLNIEFNQSDEYEWLVENIGTLESLKISGLIEGEGEVKVYLEDMLILDSNNIKETKQKKSIGITGFSIEDSSGSPSSPSETSSETNPSQQQEAPQQSSPSQEEPLNQPDNSQTQEQEAPQQSSPSQEEPPAQENPQEQQPEENATTEQPEENATIPVKNQTEQPTENITQPEENITTPIENITNETQLPENITTNITQPEENITTNITQPEENITSNITEPEENITILEFKDICEETCDLKKFDLNKSSYKLRIEITNSKLLLKEIKYEISPEILIPENITNVTNITNQPPILLQNIPNQTLAINSSLELNLLDYFSDENIGELTFDFKIMSNTELTAINIENNIFTLQSSDATGYQTIKVYASDSNYTTESNLFYTNVAENISLNITNCTFSMPREGDANLPKEWYLKEIANLKSSDDNNLPKVKNTISLVENDLCENVLLYNLSHVAETGDNIAVSSKPFHIEKGSYKITFYTKQETTLVKDRSDGFSVFIDVFDKNNNEAETFPPIVWNENEIAYDTTQNYTATWQQEGEWKKIEIDFEARENYDRAVVSFRSEGVGDYLGYVLLTNFALEKTEQ